MPETKENGHVFRQNSMERISSPEHTDDYLRLPSPGLWIVGLAAVLLIGGAVVWSIYGM